MSCEHETKIDELKEAVQAVNEAADNVIDLGYEVCLNNTPRLTLRISKEL
jgi:hypothetical protein